ncbi:uncharacterized protein BJ171DRAFT_504095 [Polychytrium aggregatum]|uniref:uncharacterized protein n=1 Tax=Polychytrium aggregatum TaxID=110093 RepID=UPI0022FE76AD|nr:uncharacterized protein BJ171DRAFT_504095 [Polychytrium aggregatum]KAI9204924.1 hypothetical protein BJ171DRAFT_504095 [Polychytrium aggregatum]
MREVSQEPRDSQNWIDAKLGKPDWDRIFDGYTATVDHPSTDFYKDLMVRYPDAKIILTVRDPEKWYKSASDTIFAVPVPPFYFHLFPFCYLPGISTMVSFRRMLSLVMYAPDATFKGAHKDKEAIKRVFSEHIESVKQHVPPSKLLVFSVSEGWEPLCKFLEVPVPNVPFPRVNDTVEFNQNMQFHSRLIRNVNFVMGSTTVALLAYAGYYVWKQYA